MRGVAVDAVAGRLYWTAVFARPGAGDATGAVYVAALDGRRRVTLFARPDAEPDDILVVNSTRCASPPPEANRRPAQG